MVAFEGGDGSGLRAVPSLRDSRKFSAFPGTSVPGSHIPPLRGWSISGHYSARLTHAAASRLGYIRYYGAGFHMPLCRGLTSVADHFEDGPLVSDPTSDAASSVASCSRTVRKARRTSSAAVAFRTNFSIPSGVNCAPFWAETNLARCSGSTAAFWRNLKVTESRLRSIAFTPTRMQSSLRPA